MILFKTDNIRLKQAVISQLHDMGAVKTDATILHFDYIYVDKLNRITGCMKNSYYAKNDDPVIVDVEESWNEAVKMMHVVIHKYRPRDGEWFAIDDGEDNDGEYTATWIGRYPTKYEFISGTEWTYNFDDVYFNARPATQKEIEDALIAEAKRRYPVPCELVYLDRKTPEVLSGYLLTYDADKDVLYATTASTRSDVVYRQGRWAQLDGVEKSKKLNNKLTV